MSFTGKAEHTPTLLLDTESHYRDCHTSHNMTWLWETGPEWRVTLLCVVKLKRCACHSDRDADRVRSVLHTNIEKMASLAKHHQANE